MDKLVAPVSRKEVRGSADALEALAFRYGRSTAPREDEDEDSSVINEQPAVEGRSTEPVLRYGETPVEPEGIHE